MSFSFGGGGASGMGPRGMVSSAGSEVDARAFDPKVVSRMLAFLKPYRGRMILAALLMLVTTGLTLLTPYLIKVAIDDHIAGGDAEGLTRTAILIALSFAGIYAAASGQTYLLGWVGQRVLANMRSQLHEHLQRLPVSYHDRNIIGVTVSRVISDVGVINELLSQGLVTLVGDALLDQRPIPIPWPHT